MLNGSYCEMLGPMSSLIYVCSVEVLLIFAKVIGLNIYLNMHYSCCCYIFAFGHITSIYRDKRKCGTRKNLGT